jgi:uncharacterized protein
MANDKAKKGFAGLDSMVSDVAVAAELSAQPTSTGGTASPTTAESPQAFTGSPASSSRFSGSGKWAVVIGAIVLMVWLVISNTPSQSRPPVSYEPTAPSPNVIAPPSTDYSPVPHTASSYSSSEETVPPVGTGLTLGRSQIRYCLSERIRMEAWQGQLDRYSQTSVDAFNTSVNDYNARCSNYRYRNGDLTNVRAEVESNRTALTRQGLSKAAGVNVSAPAEQKTPTIKTSFDCAKARSDAEHFICNDAQLAAADVDLANLFASAKAAATDQVAFKEHIREQWNYRERGCHDRDCLVQWYARQRQWLTNVVNNSNGSTQPDEAATSQSGQSPVGNCMTPVACAKAMLVFAGSENLAGAMEAAKTIDSFPKPPRGDRATARKLNQDGLSATHALRTADAVKLLERANQADPGDEEIISNLAYAYAVDGQLAKSEDTAVAALSINPRSTSVWAPLAATLAKENRLGQATNAMWLAYQFSADKQRTLTFIDSRLVLETDPAVLKMYSSTKAWLTENIKPNIQ